MFLPTAVHYPPRKAKIVLAWFVHAVNTIQGSRTSNTGTRKVDSSLWALDRETGLKCVLNTAGLTRKPLQGQVEGHGRLQISKSIFNFTDTQDVRVLVGINALVTQEGELAQVVSCEPRYVICSHAFSYP